MVSLSNVLSFLSCSRRTEQVRCCYGIYARRFAALDSRGGSGYGNEFIYGLPVFRAGGEESFMKERICTAISTVLLAAPWTIFILRQNAWALESPGAEIEIGRAHV